MLDEFSDGGGHSLAATLAATSTSLDQALARLYFVDGDDTIQCRRHEIIAAFTEPGSRVVHVCGKRFVRFAAKPEPGEYLLIHEFLHTLGLGENPPSSDAITRAVIRRCH